MSVILRPGDKVHLAFPIKGGLTPDQFAEESTKCHNEYAVAYAALGVTVALSTGADRILEPVIVAVFRDAA